MTLSEIARASGVAPSTVSRALSNPNRVSPAMYERIARKAREMGYESAMLPGGRDRLSSGTIALVLPNLSNPFNLDLIRGCQAQAQAAEFLFLMVSTEESVHVETTWLVELSQTVDGIVLASPRADDAVLSGIADNVPIVTLNREVPWLSGVLIDTPAGCSQALDYLVSLGHRHVAYVRGPESSWSDRARMDALTARSAHHGVELTPVGNFLPSVESGAAAADVVALTGATACIFFNDTLAIGALDRFRRRGIPVPERMSVVGCDDIFAASFSDPPLTTVTAFGERAGRAAADLLISQFSQRDRAHRIDRQAAHLSVRESTGPAPRD
ncbi:LacI family transcriptional regulator [Rothia sp. AR01]|uniref:LacI family transcriptional regulator n=1 Tax=Rothia santali TaxID=2949643 RepID=A0A9X2HJ67_9MICC|nr:LacI family DNA-binding transcriptional regulator [Rothia santali]MCP3426691.1 LacI family transcriptional regulator [Rothia santali]